MLAFTSLLCATSTILLACSSQQAPRAEASSAGGGLSVIEISAPAYDSAGARGDGPALAAACKAWSLSREQAQEFFRVAKPLNDGQRHDFYDLPCSIEGRLQAEGRSWDFKINAAATATWTSGTEIRDFGCSDPACEPLVLMMPERAGE